MSGGPSRDRVRRVRLAHSHGRSPRCSASSDRRHGRSRNARPPAGGDDRRTSLGITRLSKSEVSAMARTSTSRCMPSAPAPRRRPVHVCRRRRPGAQGPRGRPGGRCPRAAGHRRQRRGKSVAPVRTGAFASSSARIRRAGARGHHRTQAVRQHRPVGGTAGSGRRWGHQDGRHGRPVGVHHPLECSVALQTRPARAGLRRPCRSPREAHGIDGQLALLNRTVRFPVQVPSGVLVDRRSCGPDVDRSGPYVGPSGQRHAAVRRVGPRPDDEPTEGPMRAERQDGPGG